MSRNPKDLISGGAFSMSRTGRPSGVILLTSDTTHAKAVRINEPRMDPALERLGG